MAKVPVEETSGSGTDTLEYKCLLKNQGDIVMTLKSLKAAKCKLILKYQEKELIPLTESPTEEQLLVQALDRVRTKATEFRVFVEMLEDIKGLDLIVEKLQIQETSGPHKCYVAHDSHEIERYRMDTTDGQRALSKNKAKDPTATILLSKCSQITTKPHLSPPRNESYEDLTTSLETIASEAKDSGATGASLVASTNEVLQEKLIKAEQVLKSKEEERAKAVKRAEDLEKEKNDLKHKLQESDEETQKVIQAKEKEYEQLKREKAGLQAKLDEVTAQSIEAKSECAKLSKEVDTLRADVSNLNSEISKLTEKVNVLEKKNEEHERRAEARECRAEKKADERHRELIELLTKHKIEETKQRMEDNGKHLDLIL